MSVQVLSVSGEDSIVFLQVKYKQEVKQQTPSSQFTKLPETLETKRVKDVTALQSEVSLSARLSFIV